MKTQERLLRHNRIRAKVNGTAERPRMNIFKSLNHIYVQLIDDERGVTLASASSKEVKGKGKPVEIAAEVGKLAATKAKEKGITKITFDRGGFRYHGRIKSLADAAREAGLEF